MPNCSPLLLKTTELKCNSVSQHLITSYLRTMNTRPGNGSTNLAWWAIRFQYIYINYTCYRAISLLVARLPFTFSYINPISSYQLLLHTSIALRYQCNSLQDALLAPNSPLLTIRPYRSTTSRQLIAIHLNCRLNCSSFSRQLPLLYPYILTVRRPAHNWWFCLVAARH